MAAFASSAKEADTVTLKTMPTIFQAGNVELKLLGEDPTLARLQDYFYARIKEWPHSYIEDIDNVVHCNSSLQSILAILFRNHLEDGELDCECLRELAVKADFRHIDRLLVEATETQGDNYAKWRDEFPNTCY